MSSADEEKAARTRKLAAQIGVGTIFTATNIGLNFYNAWILKQNRENRLDPLTNQTVSVDLHDLTPAGPGFDFPIFYTMWHMVAGCLGCLVLMAISPPATGFPSPKQFWDYKTGLAAIALCTTVNIGCNNISLTLVSLFINQLIKSTSPFPTMVLSMIFEGKSYGLGMIAACGVIIGGTILAIPIKKGGPDSSFGGIILVLISTVAAAAKPVTIAVVLKGTADRPKLPPTVVLFYDSFISFWFMLVYWLASNERSESTHYIHEHTWVAIGIVVGGATMAFAFNLANYYYVQLTSALTTIVTANGIKVLILVISALLSHISNPRNWTGVALTCVALCVYAYLSYDAKKNPPKPLNFPNPFRKSTTADVEAPADSKKGPLLTGNVVLSEKTPLTEGGNAAVCCTIS